jgi:lipoprotein-anchoring transpeptidase ErfK/SrfK
VPCATGERGNTPRGKYRIQKKLKRQTMHMRMGRVRVEDVQWVMYYKKVDGLAIHAAYWHDAFGTPVSHGCVNLPREDARWLFHWSGPTVQLEDSVRLPYRADPGTRVIIF